MEQVFVVFLRVVDSGVTVDFLVLWNIEVKACGTVEHPNHLTTTKT